MLDFAIPVLVQNVLNVVPDDLQLKEAMACLMKSIAQHLHSLAKVSGTNAPGCSDGRNGASLEEYFSSREDGGFSCVRSITFWLSLPCQPKCTLWVGVKGFKG